MEEAVDGEYQNFKAKDGALHARALLRQVPGAAASWSRNMTDDEIWRLNRGGHDPHKVYAAYAAAVKHKGQPTVILAKTIKGYGMGEAGEGQNITHQQKKMDDDGAARPSATASACRSPTSKLDEAAVLQAGRRQRRRCSTCTSAAQALGGSLPRAARKAPSRSTVPALDAVRARCSKAPASARSRPRWRSCASCTRSLRDKNIGQHVVPIVPDEARTFGMEGLFRQLGIYSHVGQLYEPRGRRPADVLPRGQERPDPRGGHQRGGRDVARGSRRRPSYANHGVPMIPFYIYYSMFGFQRVGDLVWAAGDMRARGFLLGATAGPHHAQRRRPAAPGRPQPPARRRRSRTASPTTRPSPTSWR